MTLSVAFAAAMARLGPFGAAPRLAVAVSGGADSTALALLARDWAERQAGAVLALIVDHGLRAESAAEAALTQQRLAARAIPAQVITLNLPAGPALQERARDARHAALAAAARDAGCIHLLLGHHAGDQAETVAMRARRGEWGLEGMAAWSARNDIVMIRPLLAFAAPDLRDYLRKREMAWVEDPSNADRRFERVRIRQDSAPHPVGAPDERQARERGAAAFLARHATLRPEGFAVLDAAAAPPAALGALLRMIGGGRYPPAQAKVAALAAGLRPATIGGVRIVPAGRLGPGWLLAREPAACGADIVAAAGAVWDNRFMLTENFLPGTTLAALGPDAARHRGFAGLPALVLRGMPCLRRAGAVIRFPAAARFVPPAPAASHPFSA